MFPVRIPPTGLEESPVPVSVTLSGLVAAFVVKTMKSVFAPTVVGVKVTVTAQLADGARVPPQVLALMANCVPDVRTILTMVSVAVPVLVKVVVCPAEVVETT